MDRCIYCCESNANETPSSLLLSPFRSKPTLQVRFCTYLYDIECFIHQPSVFRQRNTYRCPIVIRDCGWKLDLKVVICRISSINDTYRCQAYATHTKIKYKWCRVLNVWSILKFICLPFQSNILLPFACLTWELWKYPPQICFSAFQEKLKNNLRSLSRSYGLNSEGSVIDQAYLNGLKLIRQGNDVLLFLSVGIKIDWPTCFCMETHSTGIIASTILIWLN